MNKTIIVFIGFVYFNINITKIKLLIKAITKNLNDTDRHKLKVLNRIFLAFWVILGLPAMGSYTKHMFLIIYNITWSIYGFSWIIAIPLLLIHISYGIHLVERKANKYMTESFNPKEFQRNIIIVNKLKESVNNCLGFLSFLTFYELFATICLRLTHIILNGFIDDNFVDAIQGLIEFSEIILIDLLYVFSVDYFQSQRPTVNDIIDRLSQTNQLTTARDMNSQNILIQQLVHNYSNSEYKAWNVFTINKKFLFAFLASVVSFTVMLIQLLEK